MSMKSLRFFLNKLKWYLFSSKAELVVILPGIEVLSSPPFVGNVFLVSPTNINLSN